MFHRYEVAVNDSTGVPIAGVEVRLYDASDNLVSIYSDNAGTPIINVSGIADTAVSDDAGNYSYYVVNGVYTERLYVGDSLAYSIPDVVMQGLVTTIQTPTFAGAATIATSSDTNLVIVSGTSAVGDSGTGRQFAYDATVDAAYVAANPTTSFVDATGRGFKEIPGADAASIAAELALKVATADLASTAPGKGIDMIGGLGDALDTAVAGRYWDGLGWLTPFRKRIMDGLGNNVLFSGDSTTLGNNVSADFKVDLLMADLAKDHGAYWQLCFNRGQSGQDTPAWLSTYLAGDITNGGNTPTLYVPRWGANDPAVSGLTAAQCAANWETAIDTFRLSRPLTDCPILIMTPGPMADTPNGRDDAYFSELSNLLRDVASRKKCAFFDSFNFLRDVDGLAGTVYDDPYGDGREIHPSEAAITMLYREVAGKIWGGLGAKRKNHAWNLGSQDRVLLPTDLPSSFDYGSFLDRATSANGWPRDGYALTFRPVDGTSALQFNWGFADAVPSLKMRLGQGAAWLAWQTLPSVSATSANLTPGTGFDVPATEIARASRVGDVVMLDGYIQPTGAPATLTAGQVVGTVPAGYRPSVTDWGADLQVYDASATPTMETIKAKIAIDGTITTRTASTYQADRLYFKTAYRGA